MTGTMTKRIMTGFTYTKIYKNEEINLVTVNASLDEEYSTEQLAILSAV
ncbi:MAG: hypothetical protein ACLRIT_04510 [Blautia sp.]